MLLNLLKKYFYLYDHAQRSKGIQFIQKEKKNDHKGRENST